MKDTGRSRPTHAELGTQPSTTTTRRLAPVDDVATPRSAASRDSVKASPSLPTTVHDPQGFS